MTEFMQNTSIRLATAMNRRRFIRRAATGTFAGVASLAAGRLLSPSSAFAYASDCESTTGPGCPKGCGPSYACSVQSNVCHCSDGNGGCKSGTIQCNGNYNDWGSTNCWTCTYDYCDTGLGYYYQVQTTCCDCATTYCDKDHRCIAYNTVYTYLRNCSLASGATPSNAPYKPGQVVGRATGDPSTSWGVQPPLAPVPANASAPY
jgi:hypothetical protein